MYAETIGQKLQNLIDGRGCAQNPDILYRLYCNRQGQLPISHYYINTPHHILIYNVQTGGMGLHAVTFGVCEQQNRTHQQVHKLIRLYVIYHKIRHLHANDK